MSDIEGKAARVAMSEWSRREACDIDGQTDRSKWAGAHESMRATSEFQLKGDGREANAQRSTSNAQRRTQT